MEGLSTYLPSESARRDDDSVPASTTMTQPTSSQDTESTDTLSCPSQDSEATNQVSLTSASVECQTDEVIFLSKKECEGIIDKAAGNIDMKGNLENLKTFILRYDPQPPIMDPDQFQDICNQVGVSSLFNPP